MRVGEYGVQFVAGCSFSLTAETSLTITFTKPDNTTLVVNATAPTANLVTSLGTLTGGTYASYTFLNGDVNQAGTWFAQVTYTDASQHLISAKASFQILH